MRSDKELEYDRYENRAQAMLADNTDQPASCELESLAPAIRSPYLYYGAKIRESITGPQMEVLEIGAGTGMYTELAAGTGARITAIDISSGSLELLLRRLKRYANIRVQVADMEDLPFADGAFDLVICAGSLSYGDNAVVMSEVYRVLKQGGRFICVDSLNHNPIYRLNRWIQYLRKKRSLSTIKRMPTQKLIDRYAARFGKSSTRYFGSVIWALPFLQLFFGENGSAGISQKTDNFVNVSKSAFKFVMVVEKAR